MAKQKGIIKLEGTIGDITFFKSKDGYIAKEKSSISAERIAKDPAFQRTRENGAEFGRAGKTGKLLRTAIRPLIIKAADGRMVSRLTTEMMKVIKSDATSVRGERNVLDGETELLQGFDFNIQSRLSTTLFASYEATADRGTGTLTVTIPSFVPASMITAPTGSTHYRLICAGAAVDFEQGQYECETKETAELPWDNQAAPAITLTNKVSANNAHPLFIVLGIEFMQMINGILYPLKNGAYNSLSIIKVAGI